MIVAARRRSASGSGICPRTPVVSGRTLRGRRPSAAACDRRLAPHVVARELPQLLIDDGVSSSSALALPASTAPATGDITHNRGCASTSPGHKAITGTPMRPNPDGLRHVLHGERRQSPPARRMYENKLLSICGSPSVSQPRRWASHQPFPPSRSRRLPPQGVGGRSRGGQCTTIVSAGGVDSPVPVVFEDSCARHPGLPARAEVTRGGLGPRRHQREFSADA
jgi:hypothetical protein